MIAVKAAQDQPKFVRLEADPPAGRPHTRKNAIDQSAHRDTWGKVNGRYIAQIFDSNVNPATKRVVLSDKNGQRLLSYKFTSRDVIIVKGKETGKIQASPLNSFPQVLKAILAKVGTQINKRPRLRKPHERLLKIAHQERIDGDRDDAFCLASVSSQIVHEIVDVCQYVSNPTIGPVTDFSQRRRTARVSLE